MAPAPTACVPSILDDDSDATRTVLVAALDEHARALLLPIVFREAVVRSALNCVLFCLNSGARITWRDDVSPPPEAEWDLDKLQQASREQRVA